MFLASKGIIPPEEWKHEPSMVDINHETVAMILAKN